MYLPADAQGFTGFDVFLKRLKPSSNHQLQKEPAVLSTFNCVNAG